MSTSLSSAVRTRMQRDGLRMPKPSMTTLRLFQAVMRPNVRGEMVARIIQDDGAAVAGVLRAANSASEMSEMVHSMRAATATSAGARRMARLGIAVTLNPLFKLKGFELNAERIWMQSRLASVYAEELARRLGEHTEMAFSSALMMNIGQLMALHAAKDVITGTGAGATVDDVQKAVEEHGPAVGPKLARLWKLPKPIAAATSDLNKLESNDPYRAFLRVANLGHIMARHGGKLPRTVLEHNTLVGKDHFPRHLLKFLGDRHDEFVARAEAMSGERPHKRYAA